MSLNESITIVGSGIGGLSAACSLADAGADVTVLEQHDDLGGAGLLGGAVAFYTVFVCILALPHIVVGDWLDRARGIWYVP